MASLLDLAQARLQGLLDIPTRVGRAVVNPTLFSGLLGAPTLPAQQGFAEGFAQLPAQTDMSVLDPNQAAYLQGYETGVPYGMAAAIAPFTKGMPIGASIKDVSKDMSIAMKTAQKNAALPIEKGGLGLPENNTAMDRAKALGFDVSGFHGRYKDYSEINPEKTFYVTQNPEYASLYTNPSASSMGGKSAQDFVDLKPNVMPVEIKSKEILDTRTPEGRKLFEKEFLGKYGNNTPLTDKGLPDWTDAEDFAEFFKDKKLPYKGVLVDEGSIPLPDGSIQWRGASTAVFDPSIVRSKFAAFDPKKIGKPGLMAGAIPFGLLGNEEE
jgi:hypothetical protein